MEEFTQDETKFDNADLLEPFSFYNLKLKDAFHNNAEEYFDYLTKKAETNIEANRDAVKKYDAECRQIEDLNKNVGKHKGLKGFFIFLIVFSAIAAIMLLVLGILKVLPLVVGIAVPVALVGAIVLLAFGIKKQSHLIKDLNAELDKHQKLANKHKADAEATMASLNALFESNMAAHLMSKTTPVIDLDRDFDPEKYSYLHDKYGYETSNDKSVSTLFAQSGHILGNPFVIEKNYYQTMRDHTYTGSITITWTERVSDGKGGYQTVMRSQVLTATVVEPEPAYHIGTRLIYGNEAAPNLSFSRSPTGHANDDEKQLDKYIKSFDKKLDKKVEKDLKDGSTSSFTRLHNEEFEALFNALNRDNEMEFRLLFTPLAQRNLLALMKNKEKVGYGDDFSFSKRKKLNYIQSGHMQNSTCLDKGAEELKHYSYDVCHKNFVSYCDQYCKEIYFELAPLISVPLYQQHKTLDYIYDGKFGHNVTQAEAEAAANNHSWNLFKHPATRSLGVILKSRFVGRNDNVDDCIITAHSFSGTDRVSYISKLGGDGKWHQVPVHWIEYNPISKDTPFSIGRANETSWSEFSNSYSGGTYNKTLERYSMSDKVVYKKGLFSFVKKD